MEEIIAKYNTYKYEECIDLLKKEIKKNENFVEDLILQNCLDVCECLVVINHRDLTRVKEMQRRLYKTYQNVIALGSPGVLTPLQLELNAFFNFIWWSLYHVNTEDSHGCDVMGYLSVMQRGLKRVLGVSCKVNTSINILEDMLYDTRNIGKSVKINDFFTMSLLTETIVLLMLYILKNDDSPSIIEQCHETLEIIVNDLDLVVNGLSAVREFQENSLHTRLFRFGCLKSDTENTSPVDCLYTIKAVCLFIMKKYEDVLFIMKKKLKSVKKPVVCYLGGFSSFLMGDLNQSLGLVLMSLDLNIHGVLKSRFNVLQGLILSKKDEGKKAIACFGQAKMICPDIAAVYYYIAEEYGKIGLNEEMVESLKEVVKVKEAEKNRKNRGATSTFESVIINLIHPENEISLSEAMYAAAVACGLNERYRESAEMFHRYLDVCQVEEERRVGGERIIKTPNLVTVLHEAAAMSILIGDEFRAERLLEHAGRHYVKVEDRGPDPKIREVPKDANWIRKLLDEEAGVSADGENENECLTLFTEEMVYFFDEDVVGLMLHAETSGMVGGREDTRKIALGKAISLFSKYLAQMQKKEQVSEEQRLEWTLVKALSGRTCLSIAKRQVEGGASAVETERTFKRALTCNQGDKDVLHEYCRFLLSRRKLADAQKLWETFHAKEPVVVVDQCQSLALRFLLRNQTTRRQLEKIRSEIESSIMDVDCGDFE